jgi:hypothetical protein
MNEGADVLGYCTAHLEDLVDISNTDNCEHGLGNNFGAYYNAHFSSVGTINVAFKVPTDFSWGGVM